jgi:Protein of unknown function (DUF664)
MAEDVQLPRVVADEQETMLVVLDYLRECVVRKVSDLDDGAARRSYVASDTTMLGLIRHLAFVEHYWADHVLGGAELGMAEFFGFVPPDDATVVGSVDAYRVATTRSNEVIRGIAPDAMAVNPDHSGSMVSARWVLAHLIEETGRHAGHLDILRELTDSTVGR